MSSKKPSNKNIKNDFEFQPTFGIIENEEGDYCNVELPYDDSLSFDLCVNDVNITFDDLDDFNGFVEKLINIQKRLSELKK